MPVFVIASSSKPSCNQVWERIQRRVEDRRNVLESARSMNVKRLQQDVERISKREVEFAQKLLEEIVPVRVQWNEDAWEKLQAFIPVRVEVIKKEQAVSTSESAVVEPVVVEQNSSPQV